MHQADKEARVIVPTAPAAAVTYVFRGLADIHVLVLMAESFLPTVPRYVEITQQLATLQSVQREDLSARVVVVFRWIGVVMGRMIV